jgi:hypothetical protein
MRYYFAITAIILIALFSCKKKTGSSIPIITFSSLTPDSVISANPADTVNISFKINDADGDFSDNNPSGVYLKDSRGTDINFPFPKNTNKTIDPAYGMTAECTIKISAALFLALRADHPIEDTVVYEIYVKDLAGHESNHITAPRIRIKKS